MYITEVEKKILTYIVIHKPRQSKQIYTSLDMGRTTYTRALRTLDTKLYINIKSRQAPTSRVTLKDIEGARMIKRNSQLISISVKERIRKRMEGMVDKNTYYESYYSTALAIGETLDRVKRYANLSFENSHIVPDCEKTIDLRKDNNEKFRIRKTYRDKTISLREIIDRSITYKNNVKKVVMKDGFEKWYYNNRFLAEGHPDDHTWDDITVTTIKEKCLALDQKTLMDIFNGSADRQIEQFINTNI